MEYFFTNYYVHTNRIPTDVYPIQYGEEQCKPSHHFGPCVRNNYLIHYVYHGKGIFRINGREYELQKEQLFLIPPNCSAYYRADSNDPWLYRWIEFNGSLIQTLLSDAGLNLSSPILTDTDCIIGESLKSLVEKGEMSFEQSMSHFWHFLSCLKAQNRPDSSENHAADYIRQSEVIIRNNLHKNISVNSIAEHIGIDRSYLCRLFGEYKNTSPKQYIDTLKMNRAAQYLKVNGLSVTEIALSLGYCDCHAFHKAFKKFYGCSPSDFRRKSEFEQTIQSQEEAE